VADTATVHALPDCELLVCDWLRSMLPTVPVGTTLVGWRAGTPHVQVRRTGGQVRYGWLDTADMTLEVRAASREAAATLAGRVRELMAVMAAEYVPAGATVATVRETRGPGWMPDLDGQGRYRMEWQMVAHPRRAGGP
jgi:hypothetical protein